MAVNTGMTHVVIGDTQAKPGVPTAHLGWIGRYIVDQFAGRPLRVIHVGDHADMPSLSSYDKGKKSMEGRRYKADIKAANDGWDILNEPLYLHNKGRRRPWKVDKHITLGNHEDRITRACEADAQLEGMLSLDDLNYEKWGWAVHPFLEPVTLEGLTYCLAPHHRVLMADLSYKPLGDVKPGDQLVGFVEFGSPRAHKTATVWEVTPAKANLHRVTLMNGKSFKVTEDHRWLARVYGKTTWNWVHTRDLRLGRHEICRPFDEWSSLSGYDVGWLAGFLDGEGNVCKVGGQTERHKGGFRLSFGQNQGICLDRACLILKSLGFEFTIQDYRKCKVIVVKGTVGDRCRLLGSVRPERLLSQVTPDDLGAMYTVGGAGDIVASIDSIGVGDIVQIATSTNTMIVEGYAHHNCHYFYNPNTGRPYGGENLETRLKTIGHSFVMGHQQGIKTAIRAVGKGRHRGLVCGSSYLHHEGYLGPQGNNHWRGICVLHQVENGNFDLMEVSMEFLCRKYEGKTLADFMRSQQ